MDQPLKIGLTFTGTPEKHNNYVNWLKGNDNIEITTLSTTENNLDEIADMDGIVLSGGVDMHPKIYGSTEINYPNAPDEFEESRDEFEISVFNLSQQYNKPLLSICRGMQLVNAIQGGSFIQDLGPEGNNLHRVETTDKQHPINILPGSLLYEIIGDTDSLANSAHHQAVLMPGKNLLVNAHSPEGVVEGLEWEDKTGKPFFLAIQWHPERMYKLGIEGLPTSTNIRERFIAEAKNSIKKA
ncbi:MAG: gamma-glutamyl-gamma-aminobutyrate hydrolase family protein [Ferruginibacter sp.]